MLLSLVVSGQSKILTKYRRELETFITTGHEGTWSNCDILSSNGHSYEGVVSVTMGLDILRSLNMKSVFSSSVCLLAVYDVKSRTDLSNLLEFGRKAINHVRIALIVKMHSEITLEKAANSSNLPFIVAAESEHGKDQFICPVVGEIKPVLKHEMCKASFLDLKNKSLRVGLLGIPPDFILTNDGIKGANIRLIKMLAQRLGFIPEIKVATSFTGAMEQVCLICGYSII